MKDSYYLNHQAKPRNLLIRAMLIFFMFAFHLFKVLLMATSPSFPILDAHSTSAKPEKFSSQWLLWPSAFFHPCLDTDAFVFHPIRRLIIQTTNCVSKEELFLSGRWKKGRFCTVSTAAGGSVCTPRLAVSLISPIFWVQAAFPKKQDLVPSPSALPALHVLTHCHPYTRTQPTFSISFILWCPKQVCRIEQN